MAALSVTNVPKSYSQAKNYEHWRDAMNEELDALVKNHTWDVVPCPKGCKPIGCQWVYSIKQKSDGSLDRYKARLVALGNWQEFGINYHETFAPVAKMTTVRTLLAIAGSQSWPLFQMDVKNAFLHGDLQEEVYMRLPPGVQSDSQNHVCRLRRSLYGLKQAPRAWFQKFSNFLRTLDFKQSYNDPSMFLHHSAADITILLVYVDDIIITGTDPGGIKELQASLHSSFHMKDLGILTYFLGLEVHHSDRGIFVNQHKYTHDLIALAGLENSTPVDTPLEVNVKYSQTDGDLLPDPTIYRRLVGSLIYLTITRPDISYAVNLMSQFMRQPRHLHLAAVKRIIRYLIGTPSRGIFYKAHSSLILQAYSDADWAGCPDTRRSTTGWCMYLGDALISWKCQKQRKLSKSSIESEYRAMSSACSEIVWLRRLLSELGFPRADPTPLYADNMSAIRITVNPVLHERTKHIEVDCHYIRDAYVDNIITVPYVSTEFQAADILTKALTKIRHQFLVGKLMLLDSPASI
ncbi:retrovirus-related Pol polyprotein from transposon RE1 isoform X5 [Ziziphus jujuba]|uniref:Retrovirus-related Pol polyprotein from transposon RE1 isoform X5 n=1 Tax=Ziziphus jujuba TaxID=326968 RepID=A0ABM3ZZU1_ZIZJJ|nr:retrovirus-related Pol polyprotein from transposon RE1 isoform X5 [Ziziphus jujuba]